jgi:hypothetical protein
MNKICVLLVTLGFLGIFSSIGYGIYILFGWVATIIYTCFICIILGISFIKASKEY